MKLGRTVRDADVKHLLWLREQIGSDLLDAAVLHTSPEAYRREDGISLEHRTTAPSTPLVAEPEPPGYLRSRRVSHRSAIRRIECATGDAAVADSSNIAFLLGLFGEQWNRAAVSSPLNHGHGRMDGQVEVGSWIGSYRILRVLGEGGMGVVYLAEQMEPVARQVALKILKPGMDTVQVIARFELERRALAVMEHPGIATVLDAGATATGRPYFVLERVDGVPITEYCDARRADLRTRARLFTQVCRAVQHAHHKGVIHRDIKPSNVLVAEVDGQPVCKIIDFGIARAITGETGDTTRLTEHNQSLGTPAYMSPEQVEAGGDIDTRSDIYALGVLLYQLLVGALPFDDKSYRGLAFYAHALVHDAPRPSARLSALEVVPRAAAAAARGCDPEAHRRSLRRDLDWIVMKCIEKERDRRYDTANELARDIERFLANEPVAAGPPGGAYRARKFVRRHRAAVAFMSVIVFLLAGFGVAMAVQAGRVASARDMAVARRGQAEDLIGFMVGDLRTRLTPVGRLDILDDVGERALAYFAAVPAAELSDEELLRRAVAVRQVGEVRREQGELDAAASAFRGSLDAMQELSLRDPNNPEWQKELATSHFWVGYVSWLQSDLDAALVEFIAYRDIAERHVAYDPGDVTWQAELGYATSNLGSVQEARGDLDDAVETLRATLGVRLRLLEAEPTNRDRRFDVAIGHNKVAVVLQKLGDFVQAEASFVEELALKEALVAEFPDDAPLRDHLALAHTYVGRAAWQQGDVPGAVRSFEQSLDLHRWLTAHDPANTLWLSGLGNRLIDLGVAQHFAGDRAAIATLAEATSVFEELLRADPASAGWRRGLGNAQRALGRTHLDRGDVAGSLVQLRVGVATLDALLGDVPADRRARIGLAEAHLLLGDAHAAAGATTAARGAYADARSLLEPLVEASPEIEVRGLWAATLTRTGERDAGVAFADSLRARGYREPGFIRFIR